MSTNNKFSDKDWGCEHQSTLGDDQLSIMCCRVSVQDVSKLAAQLAGVVVDTSWMTRLDLGTQRAYRRTVDETAQILCEIFAKVSANSAIAEEFGEVMVSMGSARALKMVFGHVEVPLAELWKPQRKQNEGFDFHTICGKGMLNFGEAKYSGDKSPHGLALNQASQFISEEKHLRDHPNLSRICPDAADLLNEDKFGVIAAFSLNGKNHDLIMKNALSSATAMAKKHGLKQVFLVGVSNDT